MDDYDEITKAIGKRLRAARNAAGFTLDSAASAMIEEGYGDAGKAAIGHWETGHRRIDVLPLRILCQMYDVSTDSILMGEDRVWPFTPALFEAVQELDASGRIKIENACRLHLSLPHLDAPAEALPRKRPANR